MENNNVILMLVPTMMTVAAEEMVEGHGCATVKKRLMTMVGVLCGCVQKRIREELGEWRKTCYFIFFTAFLFQKIKMPHGSLWLGNGMWHWRLNVTKVMPNSNSVFTLFYNNIFAFFIYLFGESVNPHMKWISYMQKRGLRNRAMPLINMLHQQK